MNGSEKMSVVKKVILKVVPVIFLLVVIVKTNVYGTMDTIFDYNNMPGREDSITIVDNSLKKIWGTIELALQIASVTAFIFAGVRYIFASADQKADIKKSMMFLIIGAILVFAASTVVGFIVRSFNEITS